MVTSVVTAEGSRITRHPASAWAEHRPAIIQMYVTQNMSLHEVCDELKARGFSVTQVPTRPPNECASRADDVLQHRSRFQLEYKLKQWEIQKNIPKGLTQAIWRYVDHNVARRTRQGKGSDVFIDGKRVKEGKARKEMSRYRASPTEMAIQAIQGPLSPQLPPGCDVIVCTPGYTPENREQEPNEADEANVTPTLSILVAQAAVHDKGYSEQLFSNIHGYVDACFELGVWVAMDTEAIISTSPTATLPNVGNTQCNPSTFFEYCSSASALLKARQFAPAGRKLSAACAMVRPILASEDPRMLQVFLNIFVLLKHEGFGDVAEQLSRYVGSMMRYAGPAQGQTQDQGQGQGQGRGHTHTLLGRLWQVLLLATSGPGASGSPSDCDVQMLLTAWRCIVDAYRRRLGDTHEAVVSNEMELLGRETDARVVDLVIAELRLRRVLRLAEEQGSSTSAPSRRLLLALGFNLHEQGRHAEAAQVAKDLIMRSSVRSCQGLGAYLSEAFGHELLALCFEAEAVLKPAMRVMLCAAASMAGFHGWEDPWVVRAMERVTRWNKGIDVGSAARGGAVANCDVCSEAPDRL